MDLDSWTDEQMQSILSWGNARANKYWEAKLAPGHIPSEAKIENFIRTKYELKRWVMDGPMPDPATLDADGDDEAPTTVEKEKPSAARPEAARKASVGQSSAPSAQVDLIGASIAPPRAATAGPQLAKVAPKAEAAPPKTTTTTSTKDSLLGLDFFGSEPAAPQRPASAAAAGPAPTGQSRPDLKQSILSLYATAPRQQTPAAPPQSPGLGGMPSPTGGHTSQGSMGGLSDAFSSLSFSSAPAPKAPQTDAFASLGSFTTSRPPAQASSSSTVPNLAGGSFFDAKPAASAPSHQQQRSVSASTGSAMFGAPASTQKPDPPPASSSALGDLFDLSAPVTTSQAPAPSAFSSTPAAPASTSSVFNLSAAPSQPKAQPAAATASTLGSFGSTSLSNADVWGSSPWDTPEPATTTTAAPLKSPGLAKPIAPATTNSFGWGTAGNALASQSIVPGASGGFSTAPKVAADEEFGGWTTTTTLPSAGTSGAGGGTSKPAASGGFGATEDLFSNVWQ